MVTKVGMISFAHMHAYSYADCLKQLPDRVEIAGIFDEDSSRGETVAKQFNSPFFANCDDLLNRDIQAVVICTENSKHKEYTLRSAQAGKQILCEKPISTNIADAQEMIEGCKKNNVELMIAFPCRFSIPVLRARQLVLEGKLGKILGLKGTNRGTMPGGWFIDKQFSGGGALLDHTVHVVDVWRWFLGKEVVSVYAEADQLFYPDIDIDDTGLLSIEFENGVFATLDTSWSRPNASFPTWGDVTLEIVGDQGSITVDAFRQRVEIYNNDAVKAQWACWTDNIDLGLIQSFIRMVENKDTAPITGYDGLKAMEVALAGYRSIEQGVPVSLPLVS